MHFGHNAESALYHFTHTKLISDINYIALFVAPMIAQHHVTGAEQSETVLRDVIRIQKLVIYQKLFSEMSSESTILS